MSRSVFFLGFSQKILERLIPLLEELNRISAINEVDFSV